MNTNILTKEILLQQNVDINLMELITTDTYDERALLQAARNKGIDECFAIGLHFALIGMGNKNHGNIKLNNNVVPIKKLMDSLKILYNNQPQAQLKDDDLTPKRLARLFRYHISEYIKSKDVKSFLYRKYAPDTSAPAHLIFPGAEYMIDKENAHYLIAAYANLDKIQNTSFATRVTYILQTRERVGTL